MIEKVNPSHPDKVADRIADAIVDLTCTAEPNPQIAVEVLIGHGQGHIIIETFAKLDKEDIAAAIYRIAGDIRSDIQIVAQDAILAANQSVNVHCGDDGIFKGMPVTEEQKALSKIARDIYSVYPYDGKYILNQARLIICQSNAKSVHLREIYRNAEIVEIAREYIRSVGGFEKFAEWGLF